MINTRKALPEDKNILFDMEKEFAHFNAKISQDKDKFFMEDWEKHFVIELEESLFDAHSIIYLAYEGDESDNKYAGFAIAYFCDKCWYCIIDEIFIREDYRGKGVGKLLLTECENWCKKYDCPVRIEVFEWNKEAMDFYLKKGYKKDSVVLEKFL